MTTSTMTSGGPLFAVVKRPVDGIRQFKWVRALDHREAKIVSGIPEKEIETVMYASDAQTELGKKKCNLRDMDVIPDTGKNTELTPRDALEKLCVMAESPRPHARADVMMLKQRVETGFGV